MVRNGEEYEALEFLEFGHFSMLPNTTGIEPDTYPEVLLTVFSTVQIGRV